MKNYISSLFILCILFSSCDNGDSSENLQGNWIKQSSFDGRLRDGAVCFVIDNYAYVGTGDDSDNYLVDFRKYDAKNDSWSYKSEVANLPGLARKSAVAFSAGGKGYVGLGYSKDVNSLDDFWEYNPTSNTWSQIANFPGAARREAIAFGINNYGYVGTGYDYINKHELNDFYKYNSISGAWDFIGYNGKIRQGATSFVINNKAYICFGRNNEIPVNDFYMFDPISEKWTQLENLDSGSHNDGELLRYNAVSFAINGKAYIASGANGSLKRDVWEYNPEKKKWLEKTGLENEIASRNFAIGFTVHNRGFLTTGSASGLRLDDLWEFNPNMSVSDQDN